MNLTKTHLFKKNETEKPNNKYILATKIYVELNIMTQGTFGLWSFVGCMLSVYIRFRTERVKS